MSNIYIQEPPTSGKVCLKTTVGDIDIELWSKECPKACRNFVQLCINGYYNGTVFHRLVPGFIVQGGDPTGSGLGGESIYGEPFKDEFHSRLRFTHRGLVAMANGGPNDNGSQFFFSLDKTPELQGKHTIFGKVVGNTLYNMLKLGEGEADKNERPLYPHKIIKAEILNNPFPDVVAQVPDREKARTTEKHKHASDVKSEKNLKLLSFGDEAEEEEDVNETFSGKTRSAHDVGEYEDLSAEPAAKEEELFRKPVEEEDDEERKKQLDEKDRVRQRVAEKLRGSRVKSKEEIRQDSTVVKPEDDEDLDDMLFAERRKEQKAQVDAMKMEYKQLQKEMAKLAKRDRQRTDAEPADSVSTDSADGEKKHKNPLVAEIDEERETYVARQKQLPARKSDDRQKSTLALLEKFKQRFESVKQRGEESAGDKPDLVHQAETKSTDYLDEEEDLTEDGWMAHKFVVQDEQEQSRQTKDASVKNVDSFDIYDPRNPMTKRRREKGTKSSGSHHRHREDEDGERSGKRSRHDRR